MKKKFSQQVSKIAVIMVLIMITKMYAKIVDEYKVQEITVYFLNPCGEIEKMNDKNYFFTKYMQELCEEMYDKAWMETLLETTKCMKQKRSKRSLLGIASEIGTVVNNLLKASYNKGQSERQVAVRHFNDA